jgi:hypothetical protein
MQSNTTISSHYLNTTTFSQSQSQSPLPSDPYNYTLNDPLSKKYSYQIIFIVQ